MKAPLLPGRALTTRVGALEAAQPVGFDIAPGETVALVGESGSGKSVTALSVLKLLPPAAAIFAPRPLSGQGPPDAPTRLPAAAQISGQVLLRGKDLLAAPPADLRAVRGNDISMIFQEPMSSLNPV